MGKKILLRLDDGSLIGPRSVLKLEGAGDHADGSKGAARLDAAGAHALGKLGLDHVLKLEHIVFRMEAFSKGDSWVDAEFIGKRKLEHVGAEHGNGDLKRARSMANGGLLTGSPSLASQGSWGVEGFETKCAEMVTTLLTDLREHAYIFANPVDGTKVRDYYKIIKHPMDLGTVQGKISRREYRNPQEFHDDVMTIWSNCNTYNKKGDFVQKVGARCELLFQRMWAESGLCPKQRARRTNAGVAAEKYEPMDLAPPEKKRVATGSKAPRGPGPAAKPSRSSRQVSGMRSVDTAAKQQGPAGTARGPMPPDLLQHLATALQNLDGTALEGAINIIRDAMGVQEQADGEIELDFDALDAPSLWKLHDFVVQHSAPGTFTGVAGSAPVAAAAPVAAYGADAADDESESESESESE